MGRATYIQLRSVRLKQDYQKPSERGLTQSRLFEFYDSSFGPVSYKLGELGLVKYSAEEGRQVIDSERVIAAAQRLREEVVSTRENPIEYIQELAADTDLVRNQGFTKRRALNVYARESAAEVEAIYLAAAAGGVKLSPADKRVLNPIREGRYWDVVYGNEGQYNEGTLLTRSRSRRRSNSNSAQARALREQFLEYTNERAILSADYSQRLTVDF